MANQVSADAFAKVANTIAQKHGLTVQFKGTSAYATTNGITLPAIPEGDLTDEVLLTVKALLDHEIGHHKDTVFKEILDKIEKMPDAKAVMNLTNLVEDIRIERLIGAEYVGMKENMEKGLNTPEWFGREQTTPMGRLCHSGRVVLCGYNWKEFDYTAQSKAEFGADIFERIAKCGSTWDSLALALSLLNRNADGSHKEPPPKPEPRTNPRPEKDKGKDKGKGKGEKKESEQEPGDKDGTEDAPAPDKSDDGEKQDGQGKGKGEKQDGPEGDDEQEPGESDGGEGDDDAEGDDVGDDDEDEGEGDDIGGDGDGADGDGDGGDDNGNADGNSDPDFSGEPTEAPPSGTEPGADRSQDFDYDPEQLNEDAKDYIDPFEQMKRKLEEITAESLRDRGDYVVYSKDEDEIKFVDADDRDTTWRGLRNNLQGLNVAASKMANLFLARTEARWQGDREEGRVNARALARFKAGNLNVYKQKTVCKDRDTAITLLNDCSGSMNGDKIRRAMEATVLFLETLGLAKIKTEVLGYTTGGDCTSGAAWRDGSLNHFGRTESIVTYIFKTFDEPYAANVKKRISNYRRLRMRNNADGDSVRLAADRLLKRREARKVLIVMSDGCVANQGDIHKGRAYLKRVVKDCERQGIEVVCLAIGTGHEARHFYPRMIDVNGGGADLPAKVLKGLTDVLKMSKGAALAK